MHGHDIPKAIVLFLTIVLIYFVTVHTALPHSWYPRECCSGHDCSPISSDRVQVTPTGYVVDSRHVVPHKSVKTSPDAQFHLCEGPTTKIFFCFFAPQPSM